MRRTITMLLIAAVSLSSCFGGDDFPVPREVSVDGGPPAVFFEADGRSAEELLLASDLVMQQLDQLTVARTIRYQGIVDEDVLLLSPASIWIRGEGGMIGDASPYANRSSGGLWEEPPISKLSDRGVTRAQDVRFIGESRENGHDAWVIWYWFVQTSIEVPFPVWRTEWIAKDDLRLLRQVQDDDDPWGTRARIDSVLPHP